MTSTASFHQKYCVLKFFQPCNQNDLSWSLKLEWTIKNPLLFWFLAGGYPISYETKIKFKGQMTKPNDCTVKFRSNLTCIFLSDRAKLKKNAFGHPVLMCFDLYCWKVSFFRKMLKHYISIISDRKCITSRKIAGG